MVIDIGTGSKNTPKIYRVQFLNAYFVAISYKAIFYHNFADVFSHLKFINF